MALQQVPVSGSARKAELMRRMKKRLEVEAYFQRTGRTLRKSRPRLWFNLHIKRALIQCGFQLLGLYGRGVRNALSPIVRSEVFTFANLPPEFHGFKILQISDPHIDRLPELAAHIARLTSQMEPDLCVMTGDYRFEIDGSCEGVYAPMETIINSVRAKHGIVGILGNHDAAEIALRLEEMGVRMLMNEGIQIVRGSARLNVMGLDDPFDYRCADFDAACAQVDQQGFTVALIHTPELYREAERRGIDLYLCGHTHAGQIRLPIIGAVKKNAPVPRPLVQGRWRSGKMQGYTSWGAGCSTLPVRYGCDPDVAMIELRLDKA